MRKNIENDVINCTLLYISLYVLTTANSILEFPSQKKMNGTSFIETSIDVVFITLTHIQKKNLDLKL